MNPLDMHGVGEDAGIHMLLEQLATLRQGVRDLKGSAGSLGASYSAHDLTFANGGNLTGLGGGEIDWSGSAHFSGDTTIDGNLNLAAGIIGPGALDSQFAALGAEQTTTNRASGFQTWYTVATCTIPTPDWAASAYVMATGGCSYRYGDVIGDDTASIRVGIAGEWSVATVTNPDPVNMTGDTVWLRSYPTNPPASITSNLQVRLYGPMNPSPNDRASISALAFFLR